MDEKELDLVDEDIPTFDVQTVDNNSKAQVMLLSQYSAPMSTKAEIIEAQSVKSYCRNARSMVDTGKT